MPAPTETIDAADKDALRLRVLERVVSGPVAPAELLRCVGAGVGRAAVQAAVRELVAAGEIAYALEHGRSVLEPSVDRPVRVSERITIAPPGRGGEPPPHGVLVHIAAGAAFGAGRHPTTRLALRGVDVALAPSGGRAQCGGRVLDVGTGSGVLAIAAVALGMAGGLGIDLDPCAVAEARDNVRLNGVHDRLRISDRPFEAVEARFTLVTANLRTPSLISLSGALRARLAPCGALVVSGMRVEERRVVVAAFEGADLHAIWEGEENGWAAVLLEQGA